MPYSLLNPEQQAAVRCIDGRLLILAGAGSGKTRVLTTRMAYLISECQVPPEAILGLTFTNKAAQEMRQRIAQLVPSSKAEKITLCTFHSFCMQVLRRDIHHLGFTREFSLYDSKDMERVVKLIIRDILQHDGELPSLNETLRAISRANQKGISPAEMAKESWHDQFAIQVYERLKTSLKVYNAVDFDHLLTLTVDLFNEHPDVLHKYQERYRYVMIDEYQDTNPVQFKLASLLSSKYQNLCVVGDDDQSIYGWRGADVNNILRFDEATVIKLEQNYRSNNTILKAANAIISNNDKRHPKALWSQKGDGQEIEIFIAPTEMEEAEAVAARIVKLKEKEGISWNEIAVLYRSNALSRLIELALLKQRWKSETGWVTGVPFEIVGGLEFYERREVKDLLAYFRAILNPKDQEALLRIINLPRRGIGDVALDKMTAYSRKEKIPLWEVFELAADAEGEWKGALPLKTLDSLREFLSILKEARGRLKSGELAETCRWLIERTKFEKSIEEDVKSDQMRAYKWENVEGFVSSLAEYEEKMGESSSIQDFVSSMILQSEAHHSQGKDQREKVSLMTIHSAKGLEFDACFLIGLEEHLLPHEKSYKETGIEEERRLMYVAVTRAKKWLTLSCARKRKRMGQDALSRPSPFLYEIPNELLKKVEWHTI